jgi:CBS domain-containing protein
MTAAHAMTDTVGQVMTERPVTVRPETTVAEVYDLMERRGIAACPVVNAEGQLRGILTRVDLLRSFRSSNALGVLTPEEVGRLPVAEVMRSGVVTLEPEDALVAALDLLVETRFHALPVVRRGAGPPMLVGLVTQTDMTRHLMRPTLANRR